MRILLAAIGLLLAALLTACGDDDTVATDSSVEVTDGDGSATSDETSDTTSGADEDDEELTEGTEDAAGEDSEATDDAASGGDEPVSDDGAEDATGESGVVAIQLEQVDGMFIEGFEIGLRLDSADGTTLASTLWSDMVEASGDSSLDAFYDSVYEVTVPAGEVVVRATVSLGMGPPPETPDLSGEMQCQLPVEVPADGRVEAEVLFDAVRGDCLRLLES